MASPVPYSGTITAAPQTDPLQQAHVDTPVAAFGGATAMATEHLGEVQENAGKELFQRAYAFQELDQQMRADTASADVMDKQLQRYLEYDKLTGTARADGYQDYVNDLRTIREQGMGELNSPYAKMQYLRDTRRNESAMLWHGGMLARQGMDEAAASSSKILTENATNNIATTLTPGTRDLNSLDTILEGANTTKLIHMGINPGTPEFKMGMEQLNSVAKAAVMVKALKDPNNAGIVQQQYDELVKTGKLTPDDQLKVKPALDQVFRTKVVTDISHKIGSDPANIDADPKTIDAQARDEANKERPGDKEFADQAAEMALQQQIKQQNLRFQSQKVTEKAALEHIDGTQTNGKVPLTTDEALKDPVFRQIYNDPNLDPNVRHSIDEQIKRNNTTDGWIPNDKGNQLYTEMMGTLKNPYATPAQLDAVLNTNLLGTPMTREQRKTVSEGVDAVLKAQSNEGVINQDLRLPVVQSALRSAGITPKSTAYPDFVVKFTEATRSFAEGAHRTVQDQKQIGEIANQLLMHQAGSWVPWKSASGPMYSDMYGANPGLQAKAVGAWKATHGGAAPTKDDLDSIAPQLFQEYFRELGAKGKIQQTETKTTNRAQ
jgi:hypothetical protein